MRIEDYINLLDELLDHSWSLPLSGGRCVIDIDAARDIIDDMREHIPIELDQADAVLVQRDDILAKAQADAETIVQKSEERARIILNQDEAVRAAQKKANDIVAEAEEQARKMKMASHKFSDSVLKQTEESLYRSLEELRNTRQALRGNTQP